MRFSTCLSMAILTVAVTWIAALPRRGLVALKQTRVDAVPAQPPVPLAMPIVAAPKPVVSQRPAARPTPSKPISPKPMVNPLPAPPQAAEDPIPASLGEVKLSVDIASGLNDQAVNDFLSRRRCALVAVREKNKQVLDSLIQTGDHPSRHLVDIQGEQQWKQFLKTERSTDRHLWIRWTNRQNAIGRLAEQMLRDHQLPVAEYKLYLVLDEDLSAELEREFTRQVSRQAPPGHQVAGAEIILDQLGPEADLLLERLTWRPITPTSTTPATTATPITPTVFNPNGVVP
jgi:hypothetical protein